MNNGNNFLNRKGFTLVELLAVITILAAFSVVAITNISASLKRNNDSKKQNQNDLAIVAAKIYFSNENLMKNGELVCIDYLVAEKYVAFEDVNLLVNQKQCVKFDGNGYTVDENCNEACG